MAYSQASGVTENKDKRLRQPQRFERQPGGWGRLTDEVHFLHEIGLSRLGKVAVLSNAQKSTQTAK